MKIHADHQERGRGRGRFGTLLAGLAACLFAVLPALASGGSGDGQSDHGGGNGNGSGDQENSFSAGGDETIGTLPAVGGGRIDLPITRRWRGIEPAFCVEGTYADLTLAIRGARGRGFVSCEVLDLQAGRVRLAFHGDVLVAFDRELAGSLPIDFGVAVPASFGNGRASVAWGDGRARVVRLRPGILPLPVASMSAPSVLDQDPMRIRTRNSVGVRSSHTVAVAGDLVILRQAD